MKPRWKRCAESTDALLGEALGRKYVEKHFPPEAKARMQELAKNVLLAMGDTIRGLDWMGPQTKQAALAKLATFQPKVGYPDTLEGLRRRAGDARRAVGRTSCRRASGTCATTARRSASPSTAGAGA